MIKGCPGASAMRGAQELKIKICPECGRELELFTRDTHAECVCGFIAYNDTQSCLRWCARAAECIGEEAYRRWFAVFGERDFSGRGSGARSP